MLLTDGNPNCLEDLRIYESAILDVANVEKIDLVAKMGLATEEISQEVLNMLLQHPATDPKSAGRRSVGVSDVVVTRQLKRWHAAQTLAVVYRDAYFNQLNDRYKYKVTEYESIAGEAREHAFTYGIGLVSGPVSKAEKPVIQMVAGSGPTDTVYVRVSWLIGVQEGQPSDATTIDPLSGQAGTVTAVHPPLGATGFNVYAGIGPEMLELQNATPVPLGSAFTVASIVRGTGLGNGQLPEQFVTGGPVMRRG